jgi:maltose O-acetyltransferase
MERVEVEVETPGIVRRGDDLSGKIGVLRQMSPKATFELVRRMLWARWSLRRATSVGKYVKLVGRLRVVNRGRLVVGDRVLLHANVATTELAAMTGATLIIGNGAFINYGAEICAHKLIEIGEECRIGTHCIILDNDFHDLDWRYRDRKPPSDEVVLEPHVWVGNRVTILKGVRIGFGSVVAAGSVVTKSIPPMSIAAGVPAKVVRKLES